MGFRGPLGIFAPSKLGQAVAVISLLTTLGPHDRARADDPLLKQLFERQAKAAMEEAKSPPKAPVLPAEGATILILMDGRVIDGTIRADLHGYRVQTSDANQFFSFDQVRLVARDRNDAYQKMCAMEPGNHVRRDLRLGRWCLENRLPQEAAFHLRKVLENDPVNQEAKSLLTRLEASQATGGFVKVGAVIDRGADPKIVESLSRLSPATVKEFVIGVQPILMSRCGRCHSSSEAKSFRLERVHLASGGNRSITGRNLETVLHQIDPQFSRRSPLLMKATEAHGGALHAPLSGGGADFQKARLTAWLQSVAPELNRLNREDASRRSTEKIAQAGKPQPHRDPLVVPASSVGIDQVEVARDTTPGGPTVVAPPPEKPANDLGPLTDPFDPSQFNRGK
ncbi:MAG TPA: hypothetical protein VFG04_28180 [Planctomycetaceae bacterium]|jgi:hypothetical protein|nr:hypothetical protein [Planctomycetaceae bacterium]